MTRLNDDVRSGVPDTLPSGIEHKSVEGDSVAYALDELFKAFDAFQATNNQRVSDIENRITPDVLTEEKLARINGALDTYQRRLDEMSLKSKRPLIGGRGTRLFSEHKHAFDRYVRAGDATALQRFEEKALSIGSPSDGGYLVPDETENTIMRRLSQMSPIRSIAGLRQVSGAVYKKPFSTTGPVTGWVAETEARPETASPPLAELTFPTMELYAMPAATASLLDDSVVDIDMWIAEEIEQAFAEQEGAAFVAGDGVNKPRGFTHYPQVAESSWSWGNVGYVATGVDGALPATDPSDVLVDLIYSLKAGYRQNAKFVMNRKTQASIRKLKDADGNYLWQPPATADGVSSLMSFPLIEAEDMPNIGSDTTAIAFGDFQRGYLIVDRTGVRVLRDPYSSKPYVLFYTTKRVGGGVQDFDALKLLKFGVS